MVDTLSISKELQESGMSQAQADAIAFQMRKVIESDLASKQNIKELEIAFSRELEINRNKSSENRLFLQKEMKEIESTLQKEMKEVELRLSEKSNSQLRWIVGFLLGQAGLIVALIKLIG